jgi:hypothetical protein
VQQRTVSGKHNALNPEEGEWAGKYIPVIEVEGERIINGKRIKEADRAQDPQRMDD